MCKQLGTVDTPEQFSSAKDVCTCDNSVDARRYFKDATGRNGEVFLTQMRIDNIQQPYLLIWAYVDLKSTKFVTWRPVFIPDNYEELLNCRILDMQPTEKEIYMFWKDKLYTSAFTSTGEVVIKKVKSILSEIDMYNVIKLENAINAKDLYPVELYSEDENCFVCACWSIEPDCESISTIWKPICSDDDKIAERYSKHTLYEYPIELGERVIIGGKTFKLCYDSSLGKYFERTVGALKDEKAHGLRMPKKSSYKKNDFKLTLASKSSPPQDPKEETAKQPKQPKIIQMFPPKR